MKQKCCGVAQGLDNNPINPDPLFLMEEAEVMMHLPKVKIKQPDGVNYMIQTHFYSKRDAQEYINMLISKSNTYISQKRNGKFVAPLMTIEQLEIQLENIRLFEIILV